MRDNVIRCREKAVKLRLENWNRHVLEHVLRASSVADIEELSWLLENSRVQWLTIGRRLPCLFETLRPTRS